MGCHTNCDKKTEWCNFWKKEHSNRKRAAIRKLWYVMNTANQCGLPGLVQVSHFGFSVWFALKVLPNDSMQPTNLNCSFKGKHDKLACKPTVCSNRTRGISTIERGDEEWDFSKWMWRQPRHYTDSFCFLQTLLWKSSFLGTLRKLYVAKPPLLSDTVAHHIPLLPLDLNKEMLDTI